MDGCSFCLQGFGKLGSALQLATVAEASSSTATAVKPMAQQLDNCPRLAALRAAMVRGCSHISHRDVFST
jgi:hypothetical protein